MSTALVHIESMTGIELFRPGAIDPIIAQIEAEVREQAAKLDISTEANRKALASLSYKLARSKTFFDNTGKDLVADKKKEIGAVDAERRRVWDRFEALQDEIRKPLTEWENAEKSRVASHEEALNILRNLSMTPSRNSAEVLEHIEKAKNLYAYRNWEEFGKRASDAERAVRFELGETLASMQRAEAEAMEAERLRAEAAERAIKEREEAAAKAAQEAAERRAEEQARIAREAAERERQRVAAENKRIAEEAEKRARNRAHQAAVNREAKAALVRATGLDDDGAEAIITAIAQGKITHVTIAY